jgi:Holliday junction resolvasome RuvABC endonuclease subunit
VIVQHVLGLENILTVGVDPGSISLGVSVIAGGGDILRTVSIRAKGNPLQRMAVLHGGLRKVFDQVQAAAGDRAVQALIEDGIYRARPKVCSMIGEVRGLVMAEAWRHGWTVRKVSPMTWKCRLSAAERDMEKDSQYVAYWNRVLRLGCKTPDEVDAVMIGRTALPRAG